MRRRAGLCVVAIILAVLVTAGTTLALLVHHVPAFIAHTAIPEGRARSTMCQEFLGRATTFFNALGGDQATEHEFTEQQFNSYFLEQEGQAEWSAAIVKIPDEIHDMRVALDDDHIRIGFRYGTGWWSSMVTVDLRVWLVARKPNVIALELCGFRAGALPLGTQVLLDYISEAARQPDIGVTWYRNQGHPVALLQIQANQPRPTFLVRRLEVRDGKLVIALSPTHDTSQPPAPAVKGPANP